MKPLSADTHPVIERRMIEAYRKMTPEQKLQKVVDLNRFAAEMIVREVRRRHPNALEDEIRMRLASRYLPADLMKKAFGWDPELEGY